MTCGPSLCAAILRRNGGVEIRRAGYHHFLICYREGKLQIMVNVRD